MPEQKLLRLAVRRANTKEHENILDYIPKDVTLLPNTLPEREMHRKQCESHD